MSVIYVNCNLTGQIWSGHPAFAAFKNGQGENMLPIIIVGCLIN
jgi:hypothetical protein